uniref:Uncharacterized protein n=1 Tax=Globodera rostochiensis TaxID=31243 RepID=A0A914H266_GLORO
MKPISLGQQSNGKPNSTAVRPPNWPKKSEIVSVDFGAVPFWRPWSLSSRLQISILAKLSTQPLSSKRLAVRWTVVPWGDYPPAPLPRPLRRNALSIPK